MNIIKRLLLTATSVVLLLALGGCELSALNADSLMRPPEASGDGAALERALDAALGSQITLRYPRSGEYRSAVVRADIDNDQRDEAIVFYRQATERAGAHMAVLDTAEDDENEWSVIGEITGSGEIDRVMFGDLNGDGALDIITGWSAYSDYGTISLLSLREGILRELSIRSNDAATGARSSDSYAEMAVGDFDYDGVAEILTVNLFTADMTAEARLLEYGSSMNYPSADYSIGKVSITDSVPLNPEVRGYIAASAGTLTRNRLALIIDSVRADESYSTEYVYWDKEKARLTAPVGEGELAMFSRTVATVSGDIDGDGYIELPSDELMPDCLAREARAMHLTAWHTIAADDDILLDFHCIMRPDDGYYFVIPEDITQLITAQPDATERVLYVYEAGTEPAFSRELMRIKVFTLEEWEQFERQRGEELPEYLELATTEYYVYAFLGAQNGRYQISIYDGAFRCFHLSE